MKRLLSLLLVTFAWTLPAQAPPPQTRIVVPSADSLTLTVGDTARIRATVRAGGGALVANPDLTFSGTNAAAFGVSRDGKVTARSEGCGLVYVGHSANARAQVAACVVAAAPAPAPEPTPVPVPTPVPTPAPEQPAAGVTFASDWSTALGNSEHAVKDGGRWPALTCVRTFPATLLVMPGDSVGFPGSNVLRVQMRGPTDCGMLQKNDAVPISTTHWGRFYVRNDESGNKNDHPVAYHNIHGSDDIQGVPFTRHANRLGAGRWQPGVVGHAPYPNNKWYGPALENGVWYRFEWQMEYLDPVTVRIHPRIYSDAGALLFDARHYVNDNGDVTLAQWYAGGGRVALANGGRANAELARNFGMGNEGPGSSRASMGYWYYARVALSTAGWIGR